MAEDAWDERRIAAIERNLEKLMGLPAEVRELESRAERHGRTVAETSGAVQQLTIASAVMQTTLKGMADDLRGVRVLMLQIMLGFLATTLGLALGAYFLR